MADGDRARRGEALSGRTGEAYWRRLAELLEAPELREAAGRALPGGPGPPEAIHRRALLQLLGASMALAGVSGCARDRTEKILPYTVAPPEATPGAPRFFATSLVIDGFATGLLVESHAGRPIKIEGNPDHPASLGATGVFEQASILGLYDPQRPRGLRRKDGPATWDALASELARDRADRGAGLRVLLEPTGSPLIEALIGRVLARSPAAKFTFYAPGRSASPLEGGRLAFGRPLQPQHDLRHASVILSLDADFLASSPFHLRHARHFAERRRPGWPDPAMNRLYVVESTPSPTGSMADHRLRRRPSEIPRLGASIAAELALGAGRATRGLPDEVSARLARLRAHGEDARFVQALARDLAQNAGAIAVFVGDRQPPVVHALAHALHAALGADRTSSVTAPVLLGEREGDGAFSQDLGALAAEMAAGAVSTLLILEGNPAYTAPADLDLARRIAAVPRSVYLGRYEDETARACTWFIPAAHDLESWGDARAYDGTISLIQPLLRPLWGGRTPAEVLALVTGETYPDARRLVRSSWEARRGGPDFERFFQGALKRGAIAGTEAPRVAASPRLEGLAAALAALPEAAPGGALEVSFALDPKTHDGRFANNAWLQELPHPITKLTWDNAAMLSPATAARLGIADQDVLELELRGRTVRAPALVVPGHADDTLTLPLGYGRSGGEALADGVGFDAYRLRTAAAPYADAGLTARKVPGARHPLAHTQTHWTTAGRPIALATTLAEYRERPGFTRGHKGPVLSLLPEVDHRGDQWAMSIDMSICTGCSACVVACQAENNVLVVGKEGVLRSREMHWLRIDTYITGGPEQPEAVHQPMLCQHCEKAPCEYVCPVNATVHSPDGLNEMIYNRCIGTRFCSNNCPYKVRRFNWFDWTEHVAANQGPVKLQRNPDVTVRERGVMEKCTYCVQRIREAEIRSEIERRAVRPGEVVTACQQACPTRAIQFGSLAHVDTDMVRWRQEPRSYAVLHELGTQPRTQYLARIKNPNPELG